MMKKDSDNDDSEDSKDGYENSGMHDLFDHGSSLIYRDEHDEDHSEDSKEDGYKIDERHELR